MKRRLLECTLFRMTLFMAAVFMGTTSQAQISGDVLGSHNLSQSGTSPIKGGLDPCLYCHAPHSGQQATNPALWSQTLSSQQYTLYTSSTLHNTDLQPTVGGVSSLCLSCHDGTVGVGQTQPYGPEQMTGSMNAIDIFGANLQQSHPFSLKLPMVDAPDLVSSLTTTHTTQDPLGKVQLINNNVECTSCHTPHIQATDPVAMNFLVRDGSSAGICEACHEINARTVNGQINELAGWAPSIHAQAGNRIANAPVLGAYPTVAINACTSCHEDHNSTAGGELLRGPIPPVTNMDASTQNCITCHNGGSNITPAIANIYAEFAKTPHPFPSGINVHTAGETPLLNNNRHATCADCHNAHSSLAETTFGSPLPPLIRGAQNGAVGISATDGTTVVNPAINQYENCLRCHGTSTGKQTQAVFGYAPVRAVAPSDPLNLLLQMSSSMTSSHPVLHPRASGLPQPSLLNYMWNLDGATQGRAMGVQLYCTDCHNADNNREFGGTGPNGPHGSKWSHILERRYEFSEAPGPGQRITNLYANPDLTVNGPYAICGKCHDLPNQIMNNTSWSQHSLHIKGGFSCSTCHTAHGLKGNGNIDGERLIDFDAKIVGMNGGLPITYNRGTNSCTLMCHETAHYPNGTVTPQFLKKGVGRKP